MPFLPLRAHAGVALLVFATLATPYLHAQDSIPSVMERAGTLRSKRVQESSGVALSRVSSDILWTHNDSGDKPFLYAISLSGDLRAAYAVTGARAEDWEDLAMGPCPEQTGNCLYIADTGDNAERRKWVSVYVVPEPAAPTGATADTLHTDPARELRIVYPGRPHDVEAVFVDPAGEMSLITKGRNGTILRFVVPRAAFSRDSVTAVLRDTIPITPQRTLGRLVTGAAISPSGRRVALRTYSELYFFNRSADGLLQPDGDACWLGAAEPQGEGIAFLDEHDVVLTSESLPNQDGTILRVRCSRHPSPR